MTKAEITRLAEEVLRPPLDPIGFDHMSVEEALDSTEEPSLFLNVYLKPGSGAVPADVSSHIRRMLSQTLLNGGEVRFPYLRLRHPDDEGPVDAATDRDDA